MLVNGDLHRLTQVFGNLLNNASKYSEAGASITPVGMPASASAAIAASRLAGGEVRGSITLRKPVSSVVTEI